MKNSQKTTKGMSRAVILSILIHAGLFLLAGMLVVFTVANKEEQKFEPPKAVERPKMKLKKPKVRIKKSSRPKSTARIVTKVNRQSMPDIHLPEMGGMGDGLGEGLGDGFDMMPNLGELNIFGSGQTIGNDFEGSLYSFNRSRSGKRIPMDREKFRQELRDFVLSGWDTSILNRYYRLPQKLYTTHFVIPLVPSTMAPDGFGAPDVESYYFMLHYKGQLVSQEPITFRFWGVGDAYLMVNVNGEEVFLSCNRTHQQYFDWRDSAFANGDQYYLANKRMWVGDWITLEPGKPLDMQVMFGEWLGGSLSALLNVEVQGEEYPRNRQGGPILPAFKTAPFSDDLLDKIYPHLSENETCLTNGPVFCDYSAPQKNRESDPAPAAVEPGPAPVSDSPVRTWDLMNGRTVEAALVTTFGGNVVLKSPKGKTIKVGEDMLSEEDQRYVQLENPPAFNIAFSKQCTQRFFPDPLPGWASKYPRPTALNYIFSATIEQGSTGSYDQELHAEFFAIGAEDNGNHYILLDRQKCTFTPTRENNRSVRLSGDPVELQKFIVGAEGTGWDKRGEKYSSFLVVVRDSRGEIIAHKTPKKWLFENLENLEKLSRGNYFDKTCSRVRPTRPGTLFY
jgi:hypothetical protein